MLHGDLHLARGPTARFCKTNAVRHHHIPSLTTHPIHPFPAKSWVSGEAWTVDLGSQYSQRNEG